MASKKKKTSGDDWFAALDAELEARIQEVVEDTTQTHAVRDELNRTLLEDFWRIWTRFHKSGIHFSMEPSYSQFATFNPFPDGMELKETYDFAGLGRIALFDRSQTENRNGDTLKIEHYHVDGAARLRMIFEFCEGEHYHKYSGWMKVFKQAILYDSQLDKVKLDQIHNILADVIRAWYESHLTTDRKMLIDHLREEYEEGESFTR